RKSISQGRYEIGKKVSGGNTEIGSISQGITGEDLDISGAGLTIEVGEAHIEETRCQMREMSKEKFYAQIKTFSSKRLVIMLDTCEWLNEMQGAEAAQWAVEELIPSLHTSMQKKGQQCLVLMASRIPLQIN